MRCAQKGNQSATGHLPLPCAVVQPLPYHSVSEPSRQPAMAKKQRKAPKKVTITIPGRPALPQTPVDDCVDKQPALPLSCSVGSPQLQASSAKAHEEIHQASVTDKIDLTADSDRRNKAIGVPLMSRSKSILRNPKTNLRVSLKYVGHVLWLICNSCSHVYQYGFVLIQFLQGL